MRQKSRKNNKLHIMRNFSAIFLAVCMFSAFSCTDKKPKANVESPTTETADEDSTIYGKCGDGTAMHTLELITDKGDTIVYTLEGEDTCANVQGGLFVGDRLAVIAERTQDKEPFAKKVINLTSLMGKWGSIDKNFELREGGVVESDMKEPKPYTEWKVLNGKLILSADTFDVYSLGPDSLYLEDSKGIYGYKRYPTK